MAIPPIRILLRLLVVPLFFLSVSCVKDVDMSQADEIELKPSVAIDLVSFSLRNEYLFPEGEVPITKVVDTVPLETLDEDMTEDLVSIEFHFDYNNSFEHIFKNSFTFYSRNGAVLHTIGPLEIPPSTSEGAGVLTHIDTVSGPLLETLKKTVALKSSLEFVQDTTKPVGGQLDLQATAVYNFEF